MFISDRDGIINLHQVPTSQQEANIEDNGDYGFALAFLRCYDLLPHVSITSLYSRYVWLLVYTPVMYDFTTEDRYWIEQEDQ